MKYSLTLNFDTKEEMLEFLGTDKKSNEVETKKSAPARKPKVDVMEDVKMPEMPKAVPSILPEEKVAPVQAVPLFDRNLAIVNITSTIGELTSRGIQGNVIANMCGSIFAQMNQPVRKISELDDLNLKTFSEHFTVEVAKLSAPQAAQAQSFI